MHASNKPRVFLALYHRDKLSLQPHRDELGLASLHWALLITPKNAPEDTRMLDVTDAMQVDPVRHVDTNPERNWRFREKVENPLSNIRLVMIVMIGKLRLRKDGLKELVEDVKMKCRVPKKDTKGEHCQWWVKEAIQFLQAQGLLVELDVDATFLEAHRRATDRIDSADIATKRAEVVNFTNRDCHVFFGT